MDIDRFDEGVAIASKYIGIYSALRSSGFAEADAYEMTINQQNIDFQNTVNQINKEIMRYKKRMDKQLFLQKKK